MTGTYYRPDQAILSASWPPYMLDGPQGLRIAIETLGLRTLSDLSGAWNTNAEKVRMLLGNVPAKAAAIKAVLAKVGAPEKAESKAGPDPVSDAAAHLVRDRVSVPAPAQKVQPEWPPKMPRTGDETPRKTASLDKMDAVLAQIAAGKDNAEIEKKLGLGRNYVGSMRCQNDAFKYLSDKARKGGANGLKTADAEPDPQASVVTDKLPPRPEPVITEFEAEPEELPEVEDGPADHLAAPGSDFTPARCFKIPLDGTRDAELVLPQGVRPADIEAISEYLEFLSRRLAKGRR